MTRRAYVKRRRFKIELQRKTVDRERERDSPNRIVIKKQYDHNEGG